jgi:hypothetical protein
MAAPALAGPTVTVRVEGETSTLLERTRVTLPDTEATTSPCPRWTAGAALDHATAGAWNRESFASTILGESHTFSRSDYWAEWVDRGAGYVRGGGLCTDVMSDGDELLMLVDVPPYAEGSTTELPLDLEGLPPAVQTGQPVTVTVVGYKTTTQYGDPGDGVRTPIAGATVSGGGATAVTGADGRATLTFMVAGNAVVKASKAGSVISAGEPVVVSEVAPVPAGQPAVPAKDTTAPTAAFAALRDGAVFARARAPRRLRGTVSADPSGLKSVRLAITRRRGQRCWAFSGVRERFERHRCGGSKSFSIGDRAEWSYLLPRRLPAGRYSVRLVALDQAGNASRTRLEIRVR